jgi:predicted metal-dependent hydrolase
LTEAERRALLAEGRAAYNRGDFYEAHESWEEVWLTLEDPEHRWLQGLIQVATGFHKLVQGRESPATTLLDRALAKLVDAPATWEGLDVSAARDAASAMLAGLRRGELPDPRSARV